MQNPDGKVTTYSYDALNRVSEVVNQQGITQYRYDRSSLKTRVTYPNGTQAQTTYDNAGRILTITNTQNLAVVSSYEYEYDNNGNRTQQIEINGAAAETTTYEFDLNDRLVEVAYPNETTTYTYDAAYNRKTEVTTQNAGGAETINKTYHYNNRNQVTGVTDNLDPSNTVAYAYDNNGNRIQKTQGATVTGFVYDVRDQLRTIQQGGSTIGAFLYDYQGLRIRKQTQAETTRYVYDDQSVLIQTDDLGNTISKYDYGPDKLLSLTHTAEGSQFYLFDSLGSVVNLTKPDGAIQARYQYDAWGNVQNEVGSSANVFGFTGHEMDAESGLIYMKARFYDAELGGMLSQDAFEGNIDTPPSLHKYLYAFANPVLYVDPDGNQAILPPATTATGVGATGTIGASGIACDLCQKPIVFDSNTPIISREIDDAIVESPVGQLLKKEMQEIILAIKIYKGLFDVLTMTEDSRGPSTTGDFDGLGRPDVPKQGGFEPEVVDMRPEPFPIAERGATIFVQPIPEEAFSSKTEFPVQDQPFPTIFMSEKSRGDIFEENVKDTFKGKIINQNEELFDDQGRRIGEIDFETEEAIVEVGLSLGDKSDQLFKLAEEAEKREKRLDVIYGPETPPGRLRAFKERLQKKFGNRVRFFPHGE